MKKRLSKRSINHRQRLSKLEAARCQLDDGQTADAISSLRELSRQYPKDAEVARLLATAYELSGKTLDALRQLDHIIDLGQADAAIWKTTGMLLLQHREPAQALGALRQSVQLNGNDAESRHELARACYVLGEVEEAAVHLAAAAELCDDPAPWLALATLAPGNPEFEPDDVLRIRQRFAATLPSRIDTVVKTLEVSSPRPRIGYLSSWFDKANYMKPVWALINHHDRTKFEVHLFSDTPDDEGIPGYEPNSADQVHVTTQFDNEQLAAAIRSAGIDLLIDLNAYSTPSRIGLFAAAAAPRTAAWFNMYATSGLPGIDYIIGDDVTVRPGEEDDYSEQVIRLPQSYLSFQVTHRAPPVVDPPCCKSGVFTFGSLVTQYKLTGPVLDAWARILSRVPASQLLLGNVELDCSSNRDYVVQCFERRGIERDRLKLYGRAEHYQFLEYYNEIDIALDAFPYNGGTTTTEAIWQGVPVITYSGDRWAARTSASLLYQTHLGSFIAEDEAEYIDKAVECTTKDDAAEQLRVLRHEMRARLEASPVCDARRFAAAMESAYEQILR